MNKIFITGALGRDSELKETPQGKNVLEFSAAVNSNYRKDDPPSWWRCTIWGERGVKLQPYLLKGTKLLIEGEPRLRQYETNDGVKKVSAEVVVNNVEFIGAKNDNQSSNDDSNDGFGYADNGNAIPF